MATINSEAELVQNSFEHELNKHGFGFQYRVLAEARAVVGSRWRFLASEIPVEVRGASTRIDFVLEYPTQSPYRNFMICECKRVNPALGKWGFIKAPYTLRNSNRADVLTVETVVPSNGGGGVFASSGGNGFILRKEAYHIALPLKTAMKGDDQAKGGRDDIENAVTQVLRGVNGYVHLLGANPQLLGGHGACLLPVVFTTSELWVSSADLSKADLSGNVNLADEAFKKVSWLWFQYNTSPGIKHVLSPPGRPNIMEELMVSEFVRTVAIVSSAGIRDFLVHTTEALY